jgi:lipopolysaccharide transport protein LptA
MKIRTAKKICIALLLAVAASRTLRAQTNASVAAESTNAVEAAPTPPASDTNAPASIQRPQTTVIEADGPAIFDGNTHEVVYHNRVRVDAPNLKLRCEWLAANLPASGGRVTNIVAETNVVIDATDDKGQKMHATADKAVYSYAAQNGVTNETVTLTGNAQAENSQITLTGDLIIWDRAHNRLTVPANPKVVYHENSNGAPAQTNLPIAETNSPTAETNLPPPITNDLSMPEKMTNN